MTGWEFLPNPGREEEGLGHAGIETFKGSPYPGIARECSQNSLDAAATMQDGAARPVHLIFRHLSLPSSEIPDLQNLKKTLQACLDQAKARNLKKDKEFFERAIRVAGHTHIPVLSIEDFGTTGLVGPATPGRPFYALVKSSGVSQKANADAGGSFGIGKNAAFAISSLRTVFYSTLYEATGVKVHLAQGKSILVSHEDGGQAKRATGYWGEREFEPVFGEEKIPHWLRRSKVGTTVASIGFVEESNWHWQMVESLIRNFFAAISDSSIQFTVQRSNEAAIDITDSTLAELFCRPEVVAAAETAGTTEDLKFSEAMWASMTSPETETHEKDFKAVGRFRIRLLQQKGLPSRVGILRNGMYIADNLKHFNQPLARFPLSRDFVAVLEPADRATSGRIRDMESPKHDEISAERIDDLIERDQLRRSMKALGVWIREVIKASTTKAAENEVLLDELNRFFSKPSEGPTIPDPANQNDDPERVKLSQKAIRLRPVGTGPEGDSGSSGGKKKSKSKGGRTTGEGSGKGRGSRGGRGGKNIPFFQLRNVVPPSTDGRVRVVTFTPKESGIANLEISAVGVSSDEPLTVLAIDSEPCTKVPSIELTAESRASFNVQFDSPYTGPISVVLSRIEDKSDAN